MQINPIFVCLEINFDFLSIFINRVNSIQDYLKRTMVPTKIHSTLNTTKSDTYRFISPSRVLRQSMAIVSSKFSTSEAYYMLNSINLAIENRKCRFKFLIREEEYDQQEEILQKYCSSAQIQQTLPELTEYYKYYTQTSIIYQCNFFKLMHQYREKRKIVEYNRLKIMLNLSNISDQSDTHLDKKKNTTPVSSFYILSNLNVTNKGDEESQFLQKLSDKLEKTLGPNCFRTVQELDRNYHFQKKMIENIGTVDSKCFKKIKMSRQQKQNLNIEPKNIKLRQNKRNNSCDILTTPSNIKFEFKQKISNKKKNLSMDNLSSLVKDYPVKQKETKFKLYGNWLKEESGIKGSKGDSSKIKGRLSQSKLKSQQNDGGQEVRFKIQQTKERIKREKLQLTNKFLMTNQSENNKSTKKIVTLPISPKRKYQNRKLMKMTFF